MKMKPKRSKRRRDGAKEGLWNLRHSDLMQLKKHLNVILMKY